MRTNLWITFMDEGGRTIATLTFGSPAGGAGLVALDIEDWLSHHPFTHPDNDSITDWPMESVGQLAALFVSDFGDDNDLEFVAPNEEIDHGEVIRMVVARVPGKRLSHLVVAHVEDKRYGNHKVTDYSIIYDGPADGQLAAAVEGVA